MAQLARGSEEQGIKNLQDLQPGASLVSSVESGGQEFENGGMDVEKGSIGIRAQ